MKLRSLRTMSRESRRNVPALIRSRRSSKKIRNVLCSSASESTVRGLRFELTCERSTLVGWMKLRTFNPDIVHLNFIEILAIDNQVWKEGIQYWYWHLGTNETANFLDYGCSYFLEVFSMSMLLTLTVFRVLLSISAFGLTMIELSSILYDFRVVFSVLWNESKKKMMLGWWLWILFHTQMIILFLSACFSA